VEGGGSNEGGVAVKKGDVGWYTSDNPAQTSVAFNKEGENVANLWRGLFTIIAGEEIEKKARITAKG